MGCYYISASDDGWQNVGVFFSLLFAMKSLILHPNIQRMIQYSIIK